MKKIETVLEAIKEAQAVSYMAWKNADDKYLDPTYDEEYHDTLQRKYDEGYTDGLLLVLRLFMDLDLAKIQEEIATNGAQDVLTWLEEVYGEGLHATGAWQTYMEEETDSIDSN